MTLVHKLLLVTAFLLFSCFTIKNTNPCSLKKSKIDINNLENFISNGTWNYSYSFNKDTCLVIDDLSLPLSFAYKKNKNLQALEKKHPKFYSLGKGKKLFGYECKVGHYKTVSYPLIVQVVKDTSRVRVMHYTLENGGYGDSHLIQKITKDTLILSNDVGYTINSKKLHKLRHVYLKKLSLN